VEKVPDLPTLTPPLEEKEKGGSSSCSHLATTTKSSKRRGRERRNHREGPRGTTPSWWWRTTACWCAAQPAPLLTTPVPGAQGRAAGGASGPGSGVRAQELRPHLSKPLQGCRTTSSSWSTARSWRLSTGNTRGGPWLGGRASEIATGLSRPAQQTAHAREKWLGVSTGRKGR
jgi:hypothetical protein